MTYTQMNTFYFYFKCTLFLSIKYYMLTSTYHRDENTQYKNNNIKNHKISKLPTVA